MKLLPFKDYEQIQEKYFSDPKETNLKVIEEEYAFDDMTEEEYVSLLNKDKAQYHEDVFQHILRLLWLVRRFLKKHKYLGGIGHIESDGGVLIKKVYYKFLRERANMNPFFYFSRGEYWNLYSYIDILYPDFDARNPFKDKFEFPYKHVNIDYMILVAKICYRFEILDIAEKRKLSFNEFLDYVWNWTTAFNEEAGEICFAFTSSIERSGKTMVVIKNEKYGVEQ